MSHIYYDSSFYNNQTVPVAAQIFQNRNTPILHRPKDYVISVVRMKIPTAYVPIFMWRESTAADNTPDNTYYSVTINNSRVYLIYVPANAYTTADVEYRWVYSYQQFVDAINVAFNTAYLAAAPAGCTTPPIMTFDSTTGLFSIDAEVAYASHNIYMNRNLYAFFENFESTFLGYNQALGKDYKIPIKNNGLNAVTLVPPGYASIAGYKMTQEYCSTYLWNSVRAIVLETSCIPVADEALNTRNSQLTQSSAAFRKILTDFEPLIQTGISNNTLRSYIEYYPTAEYRRIDLIGDSPLYQMDISVSFQTKDLAIYPLKIYPDESLTIKILFERKI